MALSSFWCRVSAEPHLFKTGVHIEERLVKSNDILSGIAFGRLEAGQELLTILGSTTLLPG
jgi:hypothetical protein